MILISFFLKVKPAPSVLDTSSTQMLLPLPNWPSDVSTHYLDCCIEAFTIELESAQNDHSAPVINIYAYLRGCALIARGDLLKGLEDFYLIENPNLFPKDYIQTVIVPLLSERSLHDRFQQEEFYLQSPEWKQLTEEFPGSRKSSTSSMDYPPLPVIEGDLSFEKFHDYVQRSSIVNGKETAAILFRALSHWIPKSSDTTKTRRRWSLGGTPSKESTQIPNSSLKGSQTLAASPNMSLPAKLFEHFLEIWQRTNAEKARMIYTLPKERQKQESILMVTKNLSLLNDLNSF